MRVLACLTVLGVAVAFPFIPDDPHVAAEKARFFQTFKTIESAALPNRPSYIPVYQPRQQVYAAPLPPQPKWTGPLASQVPASVQGATPFVAETPAVQAAKNAFYNAYKSQIRATVPKSPYGGGYAPARPQPKWTGPLASEVPASVPGSSPIVADTPEVRAAKAHFYNTYTRQLKATVPVTRYH